MSRKSFDDSFACHREMSRLVSLSTCSDFNRRSRAVFLFVFLLDIHNSSCIEQNIIHNIGYQFKHRKPPDTMA